MAQTLISIITGFLIGSVSGIFGVGGGFVLVPLLVIFFGFPIHTAISNSLLYVTVISISATITNYREHKIILPIVWATCLPAILFTQLGIRFFNFLPASILQILFSILLLYVSLNFFMKAFQPPKNKEITDRLFKKIASKDYILAGLIGCLAGFAAGLLGIGGGTIIVPLYNIILKIPMKTAVATSLMVIVFTGSSGVITHYYNNALQPELILPLAIAGIIGIQVGIKILGKLSEKYLKLGFAFLLIFTCIYMLWKNQV